MNDERITTNAPTNKYGVAFWALTTCPSALGTDAIQQTKEEQEHARMTEYPVRLNLWTQSFIAESGGHEKSYRSSRRPQYIVVLP